jgi:acetylornithine deacetylase/succinyl-diaminopimelate desuccinylase-like protein
MLALFVFALCASVSFTALNSQTLEANSNPPSAEPAINWDAVQREALELLAQYLKIDTTNPPGNETRAVRFFEAICQKEGIEHRTFESAPGRGTFWARVRGDGSRRPIILLNHTDVVPHSREFWTVEAFSAAQKDGFIYGRGAMDMKSLGIAQFITLLTLKRTGAPLKRDVIFLATADEEAGGREGAGWFVKHHQDLLGNAEFLLTESGGNTVDAQGRVLAVGVGVAEKTPVWLRLTATGEPGHASVPRPNSAVNRLLRALNRLLAYTPPIELTPPVEESFRALSTLRPPEQRAQYANLREAIKDPNFLRQLEADATTAALLRNTISITMLEGSNKVNVIPPSAHADIDTRIVPGEKIDRWVRELKEVIKDENIKIEPILAFEANSSPTNTALFEAIAAVTKQRHPEAVITLPVLAGFTDSHFFRDLGIVSYGFSPFLASPRELGGGFHGNDERIGIKAFTEGVRFHYEVVTRAAQ